MRSKVEATFIKLETPDSEKETKDFFGQLTVVYSFVNAP